MGFPCVSAKRNSDYRLPRGGYYYLEIEKEGTGLAPWFNYIGVTLAVLKYRMPNGHFETTLSDVQEAVKIMRKHTEDWGGKSGEGRRNGLFGGWQSGHSSCRAVYFPGEQA